MRGSKDAPRLHYAITWRQSGSRALRELILQPIVSTLSTAGMPRTPVVVPGQWCLLVGAEARRAQESACIIQTCAMIEASLCFWCHCPLGKEKLRRTVAPETKTCSAKLLVVPRSYCNQVFMKLEEEGPKMATGGSELTLQQRQWKL